MADEASRLHLDLLATRAEVGRALGEVREFLAARGVGEEPANDACLVVDEVLGNVVLHGYDGVENGRMSLRLTVHDNSLSLEVRDSAPAFDPLAAEAPALDDDAEARGIGGLGMHLVRQLSDDIAYERVGSENVLRVSLRAKP